ncbi:hypothetical protein [Caldimonas thermodepolymerans]|uniref:hypothetical protein n=1 Tax=Caldimonas thermodepolymerans TaxID=215580 RepID=UPI002490B17F|nr:hypothetical protein [Caldimonas thermodepolymerans]
MTDSTNDTSTSTTDIKPREPVDNSHLDAGIAAREARKAAAEPQKQEAAQPAAADAGDDGQDEPADTQNQPGESAHPDSGNAPAKPRKKPGVHQRIDELTKARYDAEREAQYWREQAMRQQQQPSQPAQAGTEPAPAASRAETDEPTLESCDFDVAEFNRRHYQWMREQERKQERAQQRQRALAERVEAFRAEHPDYDQVALNPQVPITKAMAEEIIETDNPPAIAYYLGKNPQEAAQIAQMSERAMARAIGRIEAKLSAQAAPPPPPTAQPNPKTVTRAPAPVTTLSGGAPAITKSPDQMTQREYEQWRREQRAAKGLPNR